MQRTHPITVTSILLAAIIATTAHRPVDAAQRPASEPIPASRGQLIVFEASNCLYCRIFRRDVVPSYRNSPRAHAVPMRFIDVHETDLDSFKLQRPIKVLPTVVLMVKGQEIARIDGYAGPEPFFHMVSRLFR